MLVTFHLNTIDRNRFKLLNRHGYFFSFVVISFRHPHHKVVRTCRCVRGFNVYFTEMCYFCFHEVTLGAVGHVFRLEEFTFSVFSTVQPGFNKLLE